MKLLPCLNKTLALSAALLLAPALGYLPGALASDHGDAPAVDQDSGADIADDYLFVDPTDNTKVVMILTVHGFIVPGEAASFATFDSKVKFEFNIENTGDAIPDLQYEVTFDDKVGSSTAPQTAHILLPSGKTFTAPTTPATFADAPVTPAIFTDPVSGVDFFAGETDDPFFFDLVAFNRFIASVKAGKPDATVFQRGRDTFAGYNVLAIVLRVPIASLVGTNGSKIGLFTETRRATQAVKRAQRGGFNSEGPFRRVDRIGNPAINVALIPFADKDAYNAASPSDDAAGKFVPDILATLKVLGTNDKYTGILAGVAVMTHGDMLMLDTSIANSGTGGGNNANAAFPNGRRLQDDVIDTILTLVNNGSPLGDNVNSNDVAFRDVFPYLAAPHQPLDAGMIDDSTRN